MTDADLLRRAATALRDHVQAATPGPWTTQYRSILDAQGELVVASVGARKDWPSKADAELIALMHPPVVLALAEVFDRSADAIVEVQFLANTGRATEPHVAHLADLLALRPLARAVLREPEAGVAESSAPRAGEAATDPNVCPKSPRVDGQLHSTRWDGDDPRTVCVFCGQVRDAITGEVIREGVRG